MNIQVTIPNERHKQLLADSEALKRIGEVVMRYSNQNPRLSTYDCVVALNERVRKLNKKVNDHKKAGGQFRDYP